MSRIIGCSTAFIVPIEGDDRRKFQEEFIDAAAEYANAEVLALLKKGMSPHTEGSELCMIENDCYYYFLINKFGDEWKKRSEIEYPIIYARHVLLEDHIIRDDY
jgi:hypothetical protein